MDNPVIFPPGRARLTMKPLPTGSGSCAMTMGMVLVALSWGGLMLDRPSRHDVYFSQHQLSRK